MKHIVSSVLAILLILTVNSSAFAFSIGVSENERHGGVNWTLEVYYTADGRAPTAANTPAYFLKSNQFEPSLANHIPGFAGKFWLLVKPHIVNTGRIKKIETKTSSQQLNYHPELGGYLIDLSTLKAGKYFVSFSVNHLGGTTTYNIVAMLWRSVHEITDQSGFFLGIYDPARTYDPAEVIASQYMGGFEPANGAAAYKNATGKDLPVAIKSDPIAASGNLVVYLYDAPNRVVPSRNVEVSLYAVNGHFISKFVTDKGAVVFSKIPEGLYVVDVKSLTEDYSGHGQEEYWKIQNQHNNLIWVQADDITTATLIKQQSKDVK